MRLLFWQQQTPTTGEIERAVNRAVNGDPRAFEPPRMHVSVDRDEIRLTGAVNTREARDLAGRLAAALPGVTHVRNELRTDADLTKELQTALAGHPGTADLARDWIVFDGVAELEGRATYDGQLAAKKMASAIDDVRDVADRTVWPSAA